MKKFLKGKLFVFWVAWAIGWSAGRITAGTGEIDGAIIGGVVVGGIAAGILHMALESNWLRNLRRKS